MSLSGEMVCPECEGGGFIAKLYPNGHTEARCEICDGRGYIEEGESEYKSTFKEKRCECGSDTVGSPMHSAWCPKYEKFDT